MNSFQKLDLLSRQQRTHSWELECPVLGKVSIFCEEDNSCKPIFPVWLVFKERPHSLLPVFCFWCKSCSSSVKILTLPGRSHTTSWLATSQEKHWEEMLEARIHFLTLAHQSFTQARLILQKIHPSRSFVEMAPRPYARAGKTSQKRVWNLHTWEVQCWQTKGNWVLFNFLWSHFEDIAAMVEISVEKYILRSIVLASWTQWGVQKLCKPF